VFLALAPVRTRGNVAVLVAAGDLVRLGRQACNGQRRQSTCGLRAESAAGPRES
jgi:hypothetical protein